MAGEKLSEAAQLNAAVRPYTQILELPSEILSNIQNIKKGNPK